MKGQSGKFGNELTNELWNMDKTPFIMKNFMQLQTVEVSIFSTLDVTAERKHAIFEYLVIKIILFLLNFLHYH